MTARSATPNNQPDTKRNLENQNCAAVSEKGVTPWRFITREEAGLACARSGKRLPTAAGVVPSCGWYS